MYKGDRVRFRFNRFTHVGMEDKEDLTAKFAKEDNSRVYFEAIDGNLISRLKSEIEILEVIRGTE